ncbi:MAG: M20/M25/M40 family metallo-hydrolase, partial [Comamonas sp.]
MNHADNDLNWPLQDTLQAWRHDFHRHPETAFQEHRTSARVAELLKSWGLEVHTGLAGTGVVAVLRGARGEGPSIGLRADMDALHVHELNSCEHKSVNEGRMHACGHDGHTTMLLGAATLMAQ